MRCAQGQRGSPTVRRWAWTRSRPAWLPARGLMGCRSSRGPRVASPSCTGPFIHPRPNTQHRGSKPAGDRRPFLRWQGPSTPGFRQPESWEAGGRPGSSHEIRSHLGVDSGPLPRGTRGRDAPHQTHWAQAAPSELQVRLPGGLFCSRPGGSKREEEVLGSLRVGFLAPSCLPWARGSPARASLVLFPRCPAA